VLATAIFLMCASALFAQVSASLSQLDGTITDPTNRVVGKATITLRDTETNRSYSTVSNDSGLYVIPNAQPGRYELTVEVAGFAKTVQTGIILTVGQVATVNVSLKIASVGQNVEVTTEAPVIEPTRTEISQVVATEQINSLPINGRLFTDFALLTPGVSTSRTSLGTSFTDYQTTQISFGGMRSYSNMVAVDGADFVNQMTGVQRSTPPQESVQEFRVVNNSFGAEFGRSAGGIVNIVTKSGSNVLHGSAYEYFQNSATDARSLLQPAPLPHELRQNQFGGTLGGPVRKDKTFFFLNYEGKRRAESPVYPPDLVNNLQLIDDTKAVLGLAPEGCFTGLSSCTQSDQSYLNGFLKTENDDWGFARLDHQIGDKHHVGLRYSLEDTRALGELVGQTLDGGGIGVPSGGRNLFVRDQSVFGTLDSTLKPNLINSALVQYARRHFNFPGMTGQPDFSLLNDLELGHNFGTDDRKYETRSQFSDAVSWIKGNHVWKFGFDGNYVWENDVFPGFTPARLLIPAAGITPIDCLANFGWAYGQKYGVAIPTDVNTAGNPATTGCPVKGDSNGFNGTGDNGVVVVYAGVPLPTDPNACSATACLPVVTATNNPLDTSTWANAYQPSLFSGYGKQINHGYWAGFFQDQWRITRKLTLNYGLRWEYESGLSTWIKPDYRGWQPRVGLAYSPDTKTVIRAGFGIFDDAYNLVFFFVPNTQKVVAGYLCDNQPPSAIATACAGITPQQLPMINSQQASQGYQLFALPGSQGAASVAASVINTGGYQGFENPPGHPNAGHIEMAGTCSTTGACSVGAGGMDHNARIPYSEQASLEIDRQFGGGFALSVSYLFVGGHRFVRGNNINIPCPVGTTKSAPPTDSTLLFPGGPPEWTPGLVDANGTLTPCTGTPTLAAGALAGLGPWFGGAAGSGFQTLSAGLLDYNNDIANALYHGLTVAGLEKLGQYFTLNANYTYSHTIDDGNFTTFVNLPVNQFDYRAERANSNQDLRHRFVANFTADTPSKGWYRNFRFSSIITLETGRPFTIFSGGDTLNDLAGGSTDRVGGAPWFSGATGSGACVSVDQCATMIPRNTYFGDSLRTWDLRLSRAFHVTEKGQLQLSIDAFNVLNRANVDEVTPVYGSPVFCGGAIPQRYEDATSIAIQRGSAACPTGPIVIPGGSLAPTPIGTNMFIPASANPNFGLPRTMFNARQFQFGARFSF
jgi:Carboxypeptidase regulatory-like domain/TonB dependent receptor